jgi:hypothetical protein
LEAHIDEGRVEFGLRRKAGVEETALPVDPGEFVLQMGVLWTAEKVEKGSFELVRVQRLVRPLRKVVGNELVKVLPPDKAVEGVDEVEALLVGHRAEGIIRVNALVADAKLGVLLALLAELLNRLLCRNTSVSKEWQGHVGLGRHGPRCFQPMMAEKSK